MLNCFVTESIDSAIPIRVIASNQYQDWLSRQTEVTKQWLHATQFRPEPNAMRLIPGEHGKMAFVLSCTNDLHSLWSVGQLALQLPEGVYHFDQVDSHLESYAIAFGLGAYQFTKYKKATRVPAKLVLPQSMAAKVESIVSSIYMVRDLVNTPAENMGPAEFAAFANTLANQLKAKTEEVIGDALLTKHYPAIHAVGRASNDQPRLFDLRWGLATHPKVTLVGKGICFDSGGLDLKSSSNMLLMKKDMAGGAHVLGLARMIIETNLPIQLRVLIPLAENVISGNAYRPGDVIATRKGLTVEIGNTDAEGRLVLADALTEAVSEEPDLLIDISTLTCAARVALGTELPAVFSNNDDVVNALIKVGETEYDPMWRLPLFPFIS